VAKRQKILLGRRLVRPEDPNTVYRFFSKVSKGEPDRHGKHCWEWQGYIDKDGYGRFRLDAKNRSALAHRVSYALFFDEIEEEMDVHHRCHNSACVRPEHLEESTRKYNCSDWGYLPEDDTVPF